MSAIQTKASKALHLTYWMNHNYLFVMSVWASNIRCIRPCFVLRKVFNIVTTLKNVNLGLHHLLLKWITNLNAKYSVVAWYITLCNYSHTVFVCIFFSFFFLFFSFLQAHDDKSHITTLVRILVTYRIITFRIQNWICIF